MRERERERERERRERERERERERLFNAPSLSVSRFVHRARSVRVVSSLKRHKGNPLPSDNSL